MSWIKVISYEKSTGLLRRIYNRIKGPDNYIDNILLVHSLRPSSLEGHMKLYKNVLHHHQNVMPKWFLEVLGIYVSSLNGCNYCVEHHFTGLKRLLKDDEKSIQIFDALKDENPGAVFSSKELALLDYAFALTKNPTTLEKETINNLRSNGLDDGEILEANQVISYFAYANRTVLGLGVNTDGEILGLSPGSSEEGEWKHE